MHFFTVFTACFFIIFSVLTLKLLPIIFSVGLSNLLSFFLGVFVNLSCVKELYFILGWISDTIILFVAFLWLQVWVYNGSQVFLWSINMHWSGVIKQLNLEANSREPSRCSQEHALFFTSFQVYYQFVFSEKYMFVFLKSLIQHWFYRLYIFGRNKYYRIICKLNYVTILIRISEKLLKNIKNKVGPRIESCGTPQ